MAPADADVPDRRAKKKRKVEIGTKIIETPADATNTAECDGDAVAGGANEKCGRKKSGRKNASTSANDKDCVSVSSSTVHPEAKDADLDSRRREAQREIQQTVVRLRKEGKSEAEIAAAKQELKRKHGSFVNPEGCRAKKKKAWQEWSESSKAEKEPVEKKPVEKKNWKHELVVIPVVWRGRHDQQGILGAAEDVKACVAQHGVDVWVDSRRQYTPGQKFAHWEFRGVMLRVEIGPEDFKSGFCQIARAITPGDYQTVEKKRIRLPPHGARSLLLALKDWGLSQIEVEKREGDDEDSDVDAGRDEAAAKGGPGDMNPSKDEDLEGNWAPSGSSKAKLEAKEKSKGRKSSKKKRKT
eukprot:TRINITY_DN54475_c0_g1_i1.p1 TRINITY_DN54475_c0_g1~~TRINITY_DN54475_c0_g1_i1.p1  ORF type:complete len:381 (-),score=87.15 TRINITY_DN54475_c0_g1_i1:141-1205(-)